MFDDVIVIGEIKTFSEKKNLKFQLPVQDNRLYKNIKIGKYEYMNL